jgi:histone H3/H4
MQAGIISMGYDGITHIGGGRVNKTDGIRHRVFIAFEPEQIKSATGNNGDFDGTNPDIRFANQAQTGSKWEVPENTKMDTFLQKIQDGKIDLKRVQEAITSTTQKPLAEAFDARLHETLYAGRVADRADVFLKTEARPLLEAMARNSVTMPELSDYLLARHAPERNAQIAKINDQMPDGGAGTNSQGVLMTTAAANAHIAALTPGKRTLLQMLANKVDTITKGTRDILVNEGLETQDAVNAWTGAYQHYVPLLKGETDTESFAAHGTGSGFSVTGKASKRSMGGEGEVSNMLAHVLLQREAAITRAEKNRVAMGLYGLALTQPNSEFWTTIKPSMPAAAIAASLQAMGVDPAQMVDMDVAPTLRSVDKATGKVVTRTNPLYKNLPGALIVKVNGEDRVILFNEKNERAMRLIANLKNLDGISGADTAMRIIGAPTRWIASLATQYNPAFGLANLTRDVTDAMLNLSTTPLKGKQASVMKGLIPAMRGVGRSLAGSNAVDAWSDLYVQFKADGGQTGFNQMQRDPNERAKNIEAELQSLATAGKLTAGKAATAVLSLLDGFNSTLENAVRLSAYKVALDQGMSRPAAARLARELTIDFNRKGSASSAIGTAYAFFNAAVQGITRTSTTLAGPAGRKIIAGGLALGVIQALMLIAAGFEDDEISDFTKSKSLIIPTGGKKYVTIPLPLGFSAIPNASRNLTELAMASGKEWDKKLFSVFGNILGSFNPVGGGNVLTASGALRTALPTALDPLGDLAMGKDFSDRPISKSISPGDPRPGYMLGRESTKRAPTSEVYAGIAQAINSIGGAEFRKGYTSPTPEEVRYVVMTIAGGLGREIEKTINASVMASQGQPVKTSQIPILGKFAGEVDDPQLQHTRYYKNADKINALKSEMQALSKSGQDKKVDELVDANTEVGLYKMNDALARKLGKINKLANDNISDAALLRELDATRTEMMRSLNTTVLELEKASNKKQKARDAMVAPEPDATDD